VVEEVRKRQKNLGPDAIRFAWVKAHVGTQGSGKADQMATSRAEFPNDLIMRMPVGYWESGYAVHIRLALL